MSIQHHSVIGWVWAAGSEQGSGWDRGGGSGVKGGGGAGHGKQGAMSGGQKIIPNMSCI